MVIEIGWFLSNHRIFGFIFLRFMGGASSHVLDNFSDLKVLCPSIYTSTSPPLTISPTFLKLIDFSSSISLLSHGETHNHQDSRKRAFCPSRSIKDDGRCFNHSSSVFQRSWQDTIVGSDSYQILGAGKA